MPELTDDKLLTMLRSAEERTCDAALTSIYQANYGVVADFIEKNSGKAEDAEDIFQEGMIALYEQVIKGSFKGTSTIRTYLFAICRNLWMKRLRRSSTKNETYGKKIDVAEESDSIVDSMVADEESEVLADLLEQLGPDCQTILLLYYYERKRMKEIAGLMNLANDQVAKNKKNRCLKKLKALASINLNFKLFFE